MWVDLRLDESAAVGPSFFLDTNSPSKRAFCTRVPPHCDFELALLLEVCETDLTKVEFQFDFTLVLYGSKQNW